MRKIVIIFLVVVLLVGCSSSSVMSIDETNPDFIYLKNAPFFANGGVGFGNETPEAIYAFGKLPNI